MGADHSKAYISYDPCVTSEDSLLPQDFVMILRFIVGWLKKDYDYNTTHIMRDILPPLVLAEDTSIHVIRQTTCVDASRPCLLIEITITTVVDQVQIFALQAQKYNMYKINLLI